MKFNKLPEGFEQVFITDCEDNEWTVAAYKGPFNFRENQPIYYLDIDSIKKLNDCWAKEEGLDWSKMPMFVNVYDEYYIVPDVNGKQEEEIIENIKAFIHCGKDLIEYYPCFRLNGTDLYSFPIPWNWLEIDHEDREQINEINYKQEEKEEEGIEL